MLFKWMFILLIVVGFALSAITGLRITRYEDGSGIIHFGTKAQIVYCIPDATCQK